MSTQEIARDVAQAFFEHFLNASKRTSEDHSAFTVYSAESIARITRAQEDGTTEEVTLNGIDSITMYNLSLPPSALTLVHYDALPTHNGGIVILATGSEIIDITDYQWSRCLVLSQTPQLGYYLKSDMLHYQVGVPLPSTTTEIIEMVEEASLVKPKKPRAQAAREKKPRAPRTPLGTVEPTAADVPITAAVVEAESPVVAVVEEVVVAVVVEPEPVVVVPEPEPVVEAPAVIAAPAVVVPVVPVETPQNSKKSWSQLVSGKVTEKRQPKKEVAAPVEAPVAKPVAAAAAAAAKPESPVAKPVNDGPKYNPKQQVSVQHIPTHVSKDALMMNMLQLGDVAELSYSQGKGSALVTFDNVADAQAAVKLGTMAIDKATVTLAPKVVQKDGFRSVNGNKRK